MPTDKLSKTHFIEQYKAQIVFLEELKTELQEGTVKSAIEKIRVQINWTKKIKENYEQGQYDE